MEYHISTPTKINVIEESNFEGTYEIEGLYPGYGYTLGHALRRIILSSLPGASITQIKIEGVNHEFSTIPGVKEDVINIILNLKQIRFKIHSDEPQTFSTIVKGPAKFTAANLKTPSQLEVINKDSVIANLTAKEALINIEMTVEKGLGYLPKEMAQKEKMEVGIIALDALFSPIRKINYEVENMRVADKTDYNRLRFFIETDGTIHPKEALESACGILIEQLRASLGQKIKEENGEEELKEKGLEKTVLTDGEETNKTAMEEDVLKIRIEDLNLSTRTLNALSNNSIRTVGGLVKKRGTELLTLEGVGEKALKEIRKSLGKLGLLLKE